MGSYRSNLERVLSEDKFAVTAEIGPPKGADRSRISDKAELLKGYADSFNVTDNQTGVVRLSSLAGSCILLDMELEPVLQMCCRDRNRIGLQSNVLGAVALGVKNMLFVTGDHQSFGNHPSAKGVYDLDSIQLIQIVKRMRDEGVFQSGDKIISGLPDVFIGTTANPFADPRDLHLIRLEKKVNAGAEFIQTQSVFNVERFKEWMELVRDRGIDRSVYILAGVTPLKSVRMAERMKFEVPGVDIPDEIYERMKNASNPRDEGFRIASELIRDVRSVSGVDGLHITALFWEEIIPQLVERTGLLPRP
ncbi:MAG: methylenetetrahydrofolate reductase [Candidatus Thermoplasmatota archaeon]